MTVRPKATQSRAQRIAKSHAKELAALEEQKRKLNAEVRAKRREMQQAERDARANAVQELGDLVAQLAGASSSDEVIALRRSVQDGDISDWLAAWSPERLDDEASVSAEQEVEEEAQAPASVDEEPSEQESIEEVEVGPRNTFEEALRSM